MNSVAVCRKVRRIPVALILVILMTFSVSGAAAAFKNIKVGDQALPVELQDLEGREHSLAKYRDSKAILLFFWATWSQRSLTELADLRKFQAEYGEKGLQIVAVNVENQTMDEKTLNRIRSVLEENEIDYTVLIDENLKTYNEWGVIATPTTAIVTSDGLVSFDVSSYPSSAYLDMEQAIQKALGLYVEEEEAAAAVPAYEPERAALLHLGLGKRHAEKGFMTKALPEFEKAAVADSGWAEPRLYLGYVHLRQGDGEKAAATLEEAAQRDPRRPETAWLRAFILAAEEKVDDAIALLQGYQMSEEQNEKTGPGDADSAQAASAAPAPAPMAGPGGGVNGAEVAVLDLSRILALRDEGETAQAGKALEGLLAGKLEEAGFPLKKKQMSAMEKMQLMMKENQGQ
jgi:peroxiredoxin